MDPNNVNSTMQSLAFGEAMKAAAEDYKKELTNSEAAARQVQHTQVDVSDFMDDPELQKLHAERLEELKEAYEKRAQESTLLSKGHGRVNEIEEGEFLEITTKTPLVVCHFFHREFQRCQILDRHLESLSKKYLKTRFIKLDATAAPFFTQKLTVRILPCLIYFINGIATGRLVGFDEFKAKDDFSTAALEQKLLDAGVIEEITKETESEQTTGIRRGVMYGKLDSEDESSDFDD